MSVDDIERMLKDDFDDHARRLENDRFAERLLFKFRAKRQRRHGVIIGVGIVGALIAASQFMNVVQSITPSVAENANSGAYQIVTILIMASALAASAMVLRQEV